jgi:hypothetical protein
VLGSAMAGRRLREPAHSCPSHLGAWSCGSPKTKASKAPVPMHSLLAESRRHSPVARVREWRFGGPNENITSGLLYRPPRCGRVKEWGSPHASWLMSACDDDCRLRRYAQRLYFLSQPGQLKFFLSQDLVNVFHASTVDISEKVAAIFPILDSCPLCWCDYCSMPAPLTDF